MMKKCINTACNADLEDYQERCPDCGRLQKQEDLTNRILYKTERSTITTHPITYHRHGFVTFWLWLGVIANGLTFLSLCLLLFSSQGLLSATPEPIWLRLIWIVLSAAMLMGYWMLLIWKQAGFYVILLAQSVSIILDLALSASITSLLPVVGLIILYSVIKIKENGISYWEAMEMR